MNITIQKPFSFSQTDRRFNSGDSIYPSNKFVDINHRLFLVCDGVGESKKGEAASSIACDSIQTYFRSFSEREKIFDPQLIEKSIRYAEIRFDEYIQKNPSARGMATTLCLLYFAPEGVYLTHAGDSRIYQFRNGKIIFKTEDNSIVNSIRGSHSPVKTDIVKITDVLPDDEFFLCSGKVAEVWSDENLCRLFSTKLSSEGKINTIKEHCWNNALDSYSAYLIPIQEVNKINVFKQIFLYAFMY